MAQMPILQYYRSLKKVDSFEKILKTTESKNSMKILIQKLRACDGKEQNDEVVAQRIDYLLEKNLMSDNDLAWMMEEFELDESDLNVVCSPLLVKFIATLTETEVDDVLKELPDYFQM